MKWQLNTYLFVSWVDSFLSLQLHHLIHNSIVSYPNAKVDKKFFKSWVLHIPHCLRDLLFNCSHLLFSSYESSFFFFSKSTESNHFLLAHIPHMNESHDPRRPFKVAITASVFFTYCFKLFFDLRYPCKVWPHGLCILNLHIL